MVMKKYKYSWDNISVTDSMLKRCEILKERGDDGWELVSVVGEGSFHCFYWKKEIDINYVY